MNYISKHPNDVRFQTPAYSRRGTILGPVCVFLSVCAFLTNWNKFHALVAKVGKQCYV